MTNRLEINWKLDGFVDEQRYYCSETPIDIENLPVPKVVLTGGVRSYIDSVGELGKEYHVRISAVKNGIEKISDEKVVLFGEEWTPLNLNTSAKLWFDADHVVTDSSNLISQITNQGSLTTNFTQSTSSRKPLLSTENGNNIISFDGVDDAVGASNTEIAGLLKNASSVWVCCIQKTRSNTSKARTMFYVPTPTGSARLNFQLGTTNIYAAGFRTLDVTTSYGVVASSARYNQYSIIIAVINFAGGIAEMYVNGVLDGSTSFTANNTANTNPQNNRASIGADYDSTGGANGNNVDSNLLAILVNSNVVLSSTERQKLEGWAAHKYGLTGNLPNDHPYKTLVPTI